ncbi:hypothetical protein PPERSA_13038 [Pseudocohnilembus persalinus]|uniref:Transmembrane protein n=1 Tax=Pseudocohnilembus persalinus TaxID=266149 RepID=A0A0V0R2D6_PSEPJ|nr:hypothetical protein PPERSA_13038 [Pseudocohnilembus persalinus]|eukprot:KRX08557.1 hypothetical protein PPERSA_13038 [Pseudocohnilembus persalinus]
MKFQIYRLLTAGFAYPHLYSVILTQLLLYLEGAELENVIGSGTYFIHLLTKTIIINAITWVFVIPTWFIFNFQFEHRDFGFFPSILCDILTLKINCSDFGEQPFFAVFKQKGFYISEKLQSLDDENVSIEQLQDMCDEDEEDEEGKNQEQQNTEKINANTDNDNQKIQIEYSSKQKEDQFDDNLENEDDNEYNLQDIQNTNKQLKYNGEDDNYNDKNNLVKQPKLIDTINNTEVSQENAAIDTQEETQV